MVPRVYALVEQVHLDVDGRQLMVCIYGTPCSFVPWGVRLDLEVCVRRLEELAAVDPCDLVDLREVHEHVEVAHHFQEVVGGDLCVLDGHVAR